MPCLAASACARSRISTRTKRAIAVPSMILAVMSPLGARKPRSARQICKISRHSLPMIEAGLWPSFLGDHRPRFARALSRSRRATIRVAESHRRPAAASYAVLHDRAMEVTMNTMMGRSQGSVWRRVRAPYRSLDRRRDLQPLPTCAIPFGRPSPSRSRFVAAISNPDFVAIAIFCAIGLLATVNLMLHVPDVGMM